MAAEDKCAYCDGTVGRHMHACGVLEARARHGERLTEDEVRRRTELYLLLDRGRDIARMVEATGVARHIDQAIQALCRSVVFVPEGNGSMAMYHDIEGRDEG